MGVQLESEVSQLEAKVTDLEDDTFVGNAIVLPLESTTNIRPTSGGINTGVSGYTRLAKVRAGQSFTINFTIESGKYLRYGYTAQYPTNGMAVSGYGEKNSTVHQATTTAPIDGYLVMECGSDFIAISVTMDNTDTIGRKVYELENNVQFLDEDTYRDVTRNGNLLSGVVYSFTVGNAPTEGTSAYYNAVKASGLVRGDTIKIRARAGSSYPTWAKLLNGVVVWASAALVDVDETVYCDGSFDEIITNSYNSYVANPYCTITHKATAFEVGAVRELRILAVGNSFSEDSIGYIPGIVKKVCPNLRLTIGIAYMGGSPLAQHYAYFSGNDVTLGNYTYKTENGQYKRINNNTQETEFSGLYTFYKSVDGGAWTSASFTVQQFLDNEDWDIITFQ